MTRSRGIAAFLVVVLVGSVLSAGLVGAAPADELSFSGDDAAPNPYIQVDSLTVARHPVDKGLTAEAMAGYYDDNGDWISDTEFVVNTSMDRDTGQNVNPYTFKPGHIDDPEFGAFPRVGDDGNSASALDASEWTSQVSDTTNTAITVADTEVAEGAPAVNIATGGAMGSGDTATATYSNWTSELDSDESKRVLQIAADVNTLDAGAQVTINVTDESGSVKTVYIDPNMNASATDVLASSTGDSKLLQVRLSKLATNGADTTWDNIQSLKVVVHDADADVSLSWVDLQSKGLDLLGEKIVDDDGDGTWDETADIYQAQGAISVHSMETIGAEFDNAVINSVSFPARFSASHLNGDERVKGAYFANFDSASAYPAYDSVLNVTYRLHAPSMIDLSYSGVSLQFEQGFTSNRYATVGYAASIGADSDLTSISLTSQSGALTGEGDTIALDATASSGTYYGVSFEIKLTQSQVDAIKGASGAAPPTGGSGGGGFINFLLSIPGMLLSAGAAFIGFRWLKG